MSKKLNNKELMSAIHKCSEIRYELLKLELEKERAARKRLERLVMDLTNKDADIDFALFQLIKDVRKRVKLLENKDA